MRREGKETISASLSTDVFTGFSSEDRLERDTLALLSGIVYVSSDLAEGEGFAVSARFPCKGASAASLRRSFGAVSGRETPTTSILEGWEGEASTGWSVKGPDAVFGSLVTGLMAFKSFVLGLAAATAEQVSAVAGLCGSAVSWVCCDCTERPAGLVSLSLPEVGVDSALSGEAPAGFVSVGKKIKK